MLLRYKLLLGLVALGIAYTAGWYTKPVEVKTETKIVEVVKERVVRDVVEIRTEMPDGMVITRTETKDRSVRSEETSTSKRSHKIEGIRTMWSIGAYTALGSTQRITVTLDRRIIGNLSIGVYGRLRGDLDSEVGLGLRYFF